MNGDIKIYAAAAVAGGLFGRFYLADVLSAVQEVLASL